MYAYVAQDPVNWVDTDGLSKALAGPNVMEGAGGAGAVGGAISSGEIVKIITGTLVNIFNDRKLSDWEVEKLEEAGHDVHELKDQLGKGKSDLFKRPNGDVCVKPKSGKGPGEDLGININDIFGKK